MSCCSRLLSVAGGRSNLILMFAPLSLVLLSFFSHFPADGMFLLLMGIPETLSTDSLYPFPLWPFSRRLASLGYCFSLSLCHQSCRCCACLLMQRDLRMSDEGGSDLTDSLLTRCKQ